MRRVIFLDIDGVLVTHRSMLLASDRYDDPRSLDAECVEAFKWLLEKSGNPDIVLSSSWRIGSSNLAILSRFFDHYNLPKWIDCTPVLSHSTRTRGDEIQAWITSNGISKDDRILILDDSTDMVYLSKFLIKTDMINGLTMELAEKAAKILNGFHD